MASELDRLCDRVIGDGPCGGNLNAYVTSAADDIDLLDIVIECDQCGRLTNGFLKLSEMMEIEQ